MADQELLRVQAVESGRTYIGASFCPGETSMKSVYQGVDADVQLRVLEARRQVQQGADPQDVTDSLDRLRHTQRRVLRGCLTSIAAGECLVCPVDPSRIA